MLKRNDLAKQFELIVQQEIQNHNASILATNQAINGMKDQIQNLIHEFARHTSRNDAWFKRTHDEFLRVERILDKKIRENKINIDCQKEANEASKRYMWEGLEELEAKVLDLDEFQNYKDSTKMELAEVLKTVREQNDYMKAALYKIKTELDKTANNFIKEIMEKPDHLWDVKAELEEKIKSAVIDSKGVLKELQVHKKEAFVMEKKIENIYDTIKKIKERLEKARG
jgi:hypothetical protein